LDLQPVSACNRHFIVNNTNRIAAGVCGIFLGAFGIHKFILGYQKEGLTMLLVTICTLGCAYPIMHVIGLVEGIIYLCATDQQFEQTYVYGKKGWF
jgi:TM2 domain-containing membrane protein YozV